MYSLKSPPFHHLKKNVIYDCRPVKPNLFIILSSPRVLRQPKDTTLSLFLSERSTEYTFYTYLSRFRSNNTNLGTGKCAAVYSGESKQGGRLHTTVWCAGHLSAFKPSQRVACSCSPQLRWARSDRLSTLSGRPERAFCCRPVSCFTKCPQGRTISM